MALRWVTKYYCFLINILIINNLDIKIPLKNTLKNTLKNYL